MVFDGPLFSLPEHYVSCEALCFTFASLWHWKGRNSMWEIQSRKQHSIPTCSDPRSLLTFWSLPKTDLFWFAQRRPVEEEEALQAYETWWCLVITAGC